jgi:3-phosphoshikimate 1-carboxyvinyltransferase
MTAPRPLRVRPGRPLAGVVVPPGDKSITHRAILLGLVARGETIIEHANPGDDCAASLRCAECLGASVRRTADGTIHLVGTGGRLRDPGGPLECGNSGTTLRLLAGLLVAQPFTSTLRGDESLHRRPVGRIIEPLRLMGALLSAEQGDRLPPLVITGAPLHAIEYRVPMASAQVATCVLFAGLAASGVTTVELPGPARDHTQRMLPAFGVPVEAKTLAHGGSRLALTGPASPLGLSLRVPGDFSAAAFFLATAAATPGARVTASGVSLNPTRTGFLDVLERMGARVERREDATAGGESVGEVTVTGPDALEACDIPADWVPRMIDEIPAWCVVAVAARGISRLTGASELRVKESDRLAVLAANLTTLGIAVTETPEGLAIQGGPVGGGRVMTHLDHRIAMTFAVLGTRARGPIEIDDATAIATSYPGFVETLRTLGGVVETGESG